MMSGDNFTDRLHKTRPVLCDLTNLPSKRKFVSISGDLGSKSGDSEVRVSHFAKKQVCLGVDNNNNSNNDVVVGKLASSKYGSIEWSRLPKSQGCTRSFELEKCIGLKGDDGCANLNAGADLLKDCSCSFCLKAAYIWSDLHYQDIKGRIAALKKSQKEATFLVQKSGRGKEIDIHGHGNSNKSSKLESELTGQWMSLFLQMEDIFGRENSQLEASFVTLKDLRENCKMDLERTTGMPSDKH